MNQTILLEIKDNIATITLNRPQAMNTYNLELAEALAEATEQVKNDATVRAVLLRGNGPMFMAGGDIHFFGKHIDAMAHHVPVMMKFVKQTIINLSTMPKPVLASVHGSAAGIGISFLAAVDFVLVTDSTKFTLAYGALGITPDGGASYFLPRLVGTRKALEMAVFAELFDAQTAKDMGLVNWVVPEAELTAATEKRLHKLANGPTQAFIEAKRLMHASWQHDLVTQLEEEEKSFTHCAQSNDFKAGVTAFIKKRKPSFNGR